MLDGVPRGMFSIEGISPLLEILFRVHGSYLAGPMGISSMDSPTWRIISETPLPETGLGLPEWLMQNQHPRFMQITRMVLAENTS
jgi:hypothetical protein